MKHSNDYWEQEAYWEMERRRAEKNRKTREQRRRELARLTGGSHVSQTMLDGAEELLAQAEKFRAEL